MAPKRSKPAGTVRPKATRGKQKQAVLGMGSDGTLAASGAGTPRGSQRGRAAAKNSQSHAPVARSGDAVLSKGDDRTTPDAGRPQPRTCRRATRSQSSRAHERDLDDEDVDAGNADAANSSSPCADVTESTDLDPVDVVRTRNDEEDTQKEKRGKSKPVRKTAPRREVPSMADVLTDEEDDDDDGDDDVQEQADTEDADFQPEQNLPMSDRDDEPPLTPRRTVREKDGKTQRGVAVGIPPSDDEDDLTPPVRTSPPRHTRAGSSRRTTRSQAKSPEQPVHVVDVDAERDKEDVRHSFDNGVEKTDRTPTRKKNVPDRAPADAAGTSQASTPRVGKTVGAGGKRRREPSDNESDGSPPSPKRRAGCNANERVAAASSEIASEVIGSMMGKLTDMDGRVSNMERMVVEILSILKEGGGSRTAPVGAPDATKTQKNGADIKPSVPVQAEPPCGSSEMKPLDVYKAEMWKVVGGYDIAANDTAITFALAYAVMVELVFECKGVSELDSPRLKRILRVMLTPPKRSEQPDGAEDMKKRLHAFFERVVRKLVRASEKNVFQLFCPTEEEKTALDAYLKKKNPGKNASAAAEQEKGPCGNNGGPSGKTDKSATVGEKADAKKNTEEQEEEDPRPKRPNWLRPVDEASFITDEHVREGRVADDVGGRTPGHARKVDIANGKEAPNADDIAKFVCAGLFTKFTTLLNHSRKAMSRAFFKDLGYLFWTWESVQETYGITRKGLKVQWLKEFSDELVKKSADIDAMIVRTYAQPDADDINLALYNSLVEATPELSLLVSHDVLVSNCPRTAQRRHTGKRRESFPHGVHLMDVAMRLIGSFGHVKKHLGPTSVPEEILSTHKNALVVVYNVAVSLRKLLTGFSVNTSDGHTVRVGADGDVPSDPGNKSMVMWMLKALKPSRSEMKTCFQHCIGAVAVDDFNEKDLKGKKGVPDGSSPNPKLPKPALPGDDVSLDLGMS